MRRRYGRGVSDRVVFEVLGDPAFLVPPVPAGGPVPGIGWLRRSVARFCDGAGHARRRRLAVDLLAGMDRAELGRMAEEWTRAAIDAAGSRPMDVMATVARPVPVGLLAAALGAPGVRTEAVVVAARSYQPGGVADEGPADRAVAELVLAFGGAADEATAARIALLLQACEATAGLVGNAVLGLLRAPVDCPLETIMAGADPPVRATRRLDPDTGAVVVLDLAGLPFGAGAHECPGRAQAVAIATGIVGCFRGFRLADPMVEWLPSAALRVPARLVVSRRRP